MRQWFVYCLPMLTVTVAFAQAPTTPAALKLYTSEQIRQMSVDDLFARLGQPEPGYQSNAARLALRAKADTDAATKQQIARRAAELATDAKRTTFERSQVFYLLAALADPATVPILVGVLTGQEQAALRSAAAWALGQMKLAEADEALKQARDQEKDEEVLKWIKRALEPAATPQQVEPQKQARFWLVKDWLRLRNFGPPASNVEFRRFFPVVDDEQIVLGRWLEARDCQTQATVPVSLVKVDADDDQNLIHTIRLASMQQNQEVTVTITAVVARHAKAAPAPPCPLIKADEYPEWARPYLTSTPMVPAGDPLVRQYAGQLLAKSQDAYEIVSQIVALMKGLPSPPKEKWGSHPELSVPAFVLQYGGFGSQGAVTCAALCRACGIPAQLTYYPGQGIMGVVDAYLPGYGYYRVQSAFGAAFMPEQGFIPPRVLNLPLESEAEKDGYMLPYHSAGDKTWVVLSDGRPNRNIRSWNFVQDGKLVQVPEPFPHLECSTVARGLGTEMFEGNWLVWEELTKLSMEAVKGMQLGAFTAIGEKVPTTKTIVDRGLTYKPEEADQQQGQAPQARPGRQ